MVVGRWEREVFGRVKGKGIGKGRRKRARGLPGTPEPVLFLAFPAVADEERGHIKEPPVLCLWLAD